MQRYNSFNRNEMFRYPYMLACHTYTYTTDITLPPAPFHSPWMANLKKMVNHTMMSKITTNQPTLTLTLICTMLRSGLVIFTVCVNLCAYVVSVVSVVAVLVDIENALCNNNV